jgi:3,5-epimerase/4-reductase
LHALALAINTWIFARRLAFFFSHATPTNPRHLSLALALSLSNQTNIIPPAPNKMAPRYLIWGARGWVAQHLVTHLQATGQDAESTMVRMEDREAVLAELDRVQPTHVLNAAGCTGRPNVDWCEDHQAETVRSNVIGTLNLADCCLLRGVHCTVFATGCIYQYDAEHPMGVEGKGFTEEEEPNFQGSFYSFTKGLVEPVSGVSCNLVLRLLSGGCAGVERDSGLIS